MLLEVGFDTVAPNTPKDISSWLHDYAAGKVEIIDNRAKAVPCYDPGYTFVEKLQTVSTKFRNQQRDGSDPVEFMRHYYDIYELPGAARCAAIHRHGRLQATHKQARFRQADNQNIAENEAFLIERSENACARTRGRTNAGSALYYADKPTLRTDILAEIEKWIR